MCSTPNSAPPAPSVPPSVQVGVGIPLAVDVAPQHPVVGMEQDRRVDRLLQRNRGVDVVVVTMGERDRGDTSPAYRVDDRGGVVSRVDDQDLPVVTDEPDVVGDLPLAAVEAEETVGRDELDHRVHAIGAGATARRLGVVRASIPSA